jgi:hypothetical protein
MEKEGVVYLGPCLIVNNPKKQRQNKDEEQTGKKKR